MGKLARRGIPSSRTFSCESWRSEARIPTGYAVGMSVEFVALPSITASLRARSIITRARQHLVTSVNHLLQFRSNEILFSRLRSRANFDHFSVEEFRGQRFVRLSRLMEEERENGSKYIYICMIYDVYSFTRWYFYNNPESVSKCFLWWNLCPFMDRLSWHDVRMGVGEG